jgi:hypothetical protein
MSPIHQPARITPGGLSVFTIQHIESMTTKQTEGYELAKGAMQYIAECLIICLILMIGFNVMRLSCGWGMESSDKSRWNRSGLTIRTDQKTGIEYLSDGHGGLVRRDTR